MDLPSLIARQRAWLARGLTRPLAFRLAQLERLEQALEARADRLAAALQADLGKSPSESYTTEIGLVLSETRHARRHLPAWMAPQRRRTPPLTWPSRGAVHPEPLGLALILGPWNYPIQLLLSPLVGALAAGNGAVLKPSEFAPQTAVALAELIAATFPPEYVTVVPGERDVAEALLRERFDAIFFTGSTAVGRAVMTAAARHLTPVTLELGGKSPCLVCADAPVMRTARRIAWGKFMNAGQTCVAPDFLYVDRRIRDALVEAIKTSLREFYGDAPERSPNYGRIVNARHLARLTGYLDAGRVVHGGQHDVATRFLAPTLVLDPPWDSPLMQEEIFGPILPVVTFDDLEEALARLRTRPTPLALYVFAADRAVQERVLAGTRSGGAAVNDVVTHMIGADLPFGGLGESGLGAYHGQASFDCFTHYRSVLRRSLRFDSNLLFPPPRANLATLKRMFRYLIGA